MSFQERQKTKNHNDQQGNHLKASVRYLVYSRLSGLQLDGVAVVTSSFSDSIVFAVHARKTAFSNSTVFKSFHSGERFRNDPFSDRCSVDPVHTTPFSNENDTVLFRIRLLSTLQRSENGSFRKRSPEWNNLKTVLFENAVFLVWTAKMILSENDAVTTTTPPGCM